MLENTALSIENVTYHYGSRLALDGISQSISAGQVFVILGPNGSGKSTLFKLASTLIPLQTGEIFIAGHSVREQANQVRRHLGVVFQYPSLDKKLTVRENIDCQASLFGLRGKLRTNRVDEVLKKLGLTDRTNERVEKLSGGLKRRVELAKGILHRPSVLLLDEPSTGLDPSARLDYWAALQELRKEAGTTVIMTTHLLEEADKADSIAIFHQGKIVAQDSPEKLRRDMGQNIVTIQSRSAVDAQELVQSRFGWSSDLVGNQIRIRNAEAAQRVTDLSDALGNMADSLTIGRPSLEDVFVEKTGVSYSADAAIAS